MNRPPLITLLICIYCILNSINLIETWQFSQKDRFGIVALIFWITPVFLFWIRQSKLEGTVKDRPVLLGIALLCSFNGMVGSLHVLEHIGLACAFGALVPPLGINMVWIASSISSRSHSISTAM